MNCKIIVAAHKPYWMPADPCYLPLQVGSAGRESFGLTRDDSGDAISNKNPYYCELTGLYWAWKNIRADYIGLVHYRRYFARPGFAFGAAGRKNAILGTDDWRELLPRHSLILPRRRNYFITSRRNQFIKAHGAAALECVESVMRRRCPEYFPAYATSMGRTWGHIFNMFVMRHDLFDAYCDWLFPLLADVAEEIRNKNGEVAPRLLGFIGERLLDVWVEHHRLPYKETGYVTLESINWPGKLAAFLRRTVGGG